MPGRDVPGRDAAGGAPVRAVRDVEGRGPAPGDWLKIQPSRPFLPLGASSAGAGAAFASALREESRAAASHVPSQTAATRRAASASEVSGEPASTPASPYTAKRREAGRSPAVRHGA